MNGESIVNKLIADAAAKKKHEEFAVENEVQYAEALNRLAATSDGQYVLKQLLKFCGVFAIDPVTNPQASLGRIERSNVYLRMIRLYLDKENIRGIET